MMKKVSIISFIVFIFFLTYSARTKVNAIFCAPLPPVYEAFEQSNIVFSGKVVEVTKLTGSSYGYFEVKFEVYDVWKGADTKFLTVIDSTWATGSVPNLARSTFSIGSEYLIFLRDGPVVGLCPWKRNLSYAQDEIQELERISRTNESPIYNLYYRFKLLTHYKIRLRLFDYYHISLMQILILGGGVTAIVIFVKVLRNKKTNNDS